MIGLIFWPVLLCIGIVNGWHWAVLLLLAFPAVPGIFTGVVLVATFTAVALQSIRGLFK